MKKKETPTEHLLTIEVPLDTRGEHFKTIQVNTLQLLGIYWTEGYRAGSDETYCRRTNKLWKKKHPFLSKIYVPMRFWANEFAWDFWCRPTVELSYGESKTVLRMSSNDAAKSLCTYLKARFFKDEVF